MKKNITELLVELNKELEDLPELAQMAVCWTIENFDIVYGICRETKNISDEELRKYEKDAIVKEDYVSLSIICFTRMYKEKDKQKSSDK